MADFAQFLLQQLTTEQRIQHDSLSAEDRKTVLQRLAAQWYQVWRPAFDTVAHDPLDPAKRYHEGVFVENKPEQSRGTLFHVTGDILAISGMRYEERTEYNPTQTRLFHSITLIGFVRRADFEAVVRTLQALPRPTRQQSINFWEPDPVTGRHPIMWCREDGERYAPGEERRPVFKCNEWTDMAVRVLRQTRVLHE